VVTRRIGQIHTCALRAPLARANLTLEISSASSIPSPAASSTPSNVADPWRLPFDVGLKGRRNPKCLAIRPSISLERRRGWDPPVAPGVIPAYDQALAYICSDAAAVQVESDILRLGIKRVWYLLRGERLRMGWLCVPTQLQLRLTDTTLCHSDMNHKVYRHLVGETRRFGPSRMLLYPSVLPVQYPFLNKPSNGASLPDARYSGRPSWAPTHS